MTEFSVQDILQISFIAKDKDIACAFADFKAAELPIAGLFQVKKKNGVSLVKLFPGTFDEDDGFKQDTDDIIQFRNELADRDIEYEDYTQLLVTNPDVATIQSLFYAVGVSPMAVYTVNQTGMVYDIQACKLKLAKTALELSVDQQKKLIKARLNCAKKCRKFDGPCHDDEDENDDCGECNACNACDEDENGDKPCDTCGQYHAN